MRVVISLNLPTQVEDRDGSSSVVVEFLSEHAESGELRRDIEPGWDSAFPPEDAVAAQGSLVSILLGGPHDEQVRRDIPVGEHIVEDPAFDPIGFYGLVAIDRGGVPVVQWYRWMCHDEAEGLG